MQDRELLRQYLDAQSEPAFAELVERHVGLVYGAAWRILREPELARDAAQCTFIHLARKAGTVRNPEALGGWLYRTATRCATNLLRAEQRRHQREAEAVNARALNDDPTAAWEAIAPLLEEGMRRLKPAEQDALVLRYFQGRSLREASRRLAITEDAMQKRVSRALEKLRGHFARRGVAISAVAITGVLTTHSATAAPAGLAAALASASLAQSASAAAGGWASLLKLLPMTKLQAVALSLLFLAGLATPPIVTGHVRARRTAPVSALDSATTAGPQRAVGLPAEATEPAATTAARSSSAALAALRDWLEQADRSTYFATSKEDKLRQLVRALGAEDFARAWELPVKSRGVREKLRHILMARWAETNPQAALAAALNVPERRARHDLLDSAVSAWGGKEPAAAAAWVKSFYPEAERASKLMLVFHACGLHQPQAARALWQQMPPGVARDAAAQTFMESLAREDRDAAIACLGAIQSSVLRHEARGYVLMQWAGTDPAAALAWAQQQPGPQERDDAMFAVLAALREQNPAQAAEALKSLSPTALGRGERAIDAVIGQWVARDLKAASAWVTQLPEGMLREHALDGLIARWAMQAPQAAATYVETLPQGPARVKFLTEVASQWAMHDTKGVQGWIAALPEGPARDAVVSGFGDGLACRKPAEAASFVAALPPGEVQSAAALKVVERWARSDPAAAGTWVAAFPSGQTRDRAIEKLVREWRMADSQSAEAWLQQAGLSPEAKERLLRR